MNASPTHSSQSSRYGSSVAAAKQVAFAILRSVRRRSDRNLFWWKGPPVNFGDLVGPYLFRRITGREPRWRRPANRALTTIFVTAGSLGRFIREDSVVWGTGIIRRDQSLFRPTEIRAVRGPHTRARFLELGYPCPAVFGDPGLLLPHFYEPRRARTHAVGAVPHYVDLENARASLSNCPNVKLIDVRQPVEAVVDEIVSCEAIVSSSLHGLLVAHAYGVPAAWVEFSGNIRGDGTKFLDYYLSVDIAPPPAPIPILGAILADDLGDVAKSAPLPTPQPLVRPLLDACPF